MSHISEQLIAICLRHGINIPAPDRIVQGHVLQAIANVMNADLPEGFVELYLDCDGSGGQGVITTSDLGFPCAALLPLCEVLVNACAYGREFCEELSAYYDCPDGLNEDPRLTGGVLWCVGWLPFCSNDGILLDLSPGPAGTAGQVCYNSWIGGFATLEVAFDSFDEFMRDSLEQLEASRPLQRDNVEGPSIEQWAKAIEFARGEFSPRVVEALELAASQV